MPEIVKGDIEYGTLNQKQILLVGKDQVVYRKTVPQSDIPWLGLGFKENGQDTHAYLYVNGREINKENNRINVPPEFVIHKEILQGQELHLEWPAHAGTCACAAQYEGTKIELYVSTLEKERKIRPSITTTIRA
ncbi:MAG: hypothetical protein QCI38_03170, partial [Candidatus Thermoplasmatota archaeon]|nr:hypothetical protein [Candidatus Thermoplasmatota archaeon]